VISASSAGRTDPTLGSPERRDFRHGDVPPPSGGDARRQRLWISAATVLLTAGIIGSVVGGFFWARYQQTQTARSFRTTASSVAASLGASVNRDLDFQDLLSSMIATNPGLTNRQLAPWLTALDVTKRYPGTLGFGFFEPISAAMLPAFLAEMQADPRVGSAAGPVVVYPPGLRAQYCLARLGFLSVSNSLLADLDGIDICAPTSPGTPSLAPAATYKGVTDSGQSAVLASLVTAKEAKKFDISGAELQSLRDLVVIIAPVYRGGTTPTTSLARQQASIGWLVGSFSAKGLFGSSLSGNRALAVQVRRGTAASASLVASEGPPIPGAHLTFTKTVAASPLLGVVVVGSSGSAGFAQGIALGVIGAALSLVLFMFLFHLGRSRERALRLVEQRTGQLQHQALHDPLTGLPNRALLFDRAEQMLFRSQRQTLAIGALYVDLDNFKDVNDSFGHQFGDQLLRAVGARLGAALRPSDTVGRLGGDEFLVLVEGDGLDAGPELVAERLHAVMSEPFDLQAHEPIRLTIRASIGVAVGRRDTADELFRDADVALYAAKAAGKDRYVVFRPEMQTAIHDRLDLEMDLRRAVERDEFFLVYQPIFDLGSLAPKGVEALIRWRHPTKGLVQPDDFIPLAEETGLIVPIGRFVLNQACRQAVSWHALGLRINMAVNVSVVELESTSLVDDVRHTLERTGLDPAFLTLEITETSLMHDTELTARVLHELKSLGLSLSIDDFGTGYSSLAYLRQFPIDTLKIDRTFITKATQTSESGALIRTLIQLGKALGIETLAEGIEEEAQLDRLQREQCDSGQGFLFARPLEPADIEAFFAGKKELDTNRVSEPDHGANLARS
jgi:diguanylate cyclase (GGDEF)-like protein